MKPTHFLVLISSLTAGACATAASAPTATQVAAPGPTRCEVTVVSASIASTTGEGQPWHVAEPSIAGVSVQAIKVKGSGTLLEAKNPIPIGNGIVLPAGEYSVVAIQSPNGIPVFTIRDERGNAIVLDLKGKGVRLSDAMDAELWGKAKNIGIGGDAIISELRVDRVIAVGEGDKRTFALYGAQVTLAEDAVICHPRVESRISAGSVIHLSAGDFASTGGFRRESGVETAIYSHPETGQQGLILTNPVYNAAGRVASADKLEFLKRDGSGVVEYVVAAPRYNDKMDIVDFDPTKSSKNADDLVGPAPPEGKPDTPLPLRGSGLAVGWDPNLRSVVISDPYGGHYAVDPKKVRFNFDDEGRVTGIEMAMFRGGYSTPIWSQCVLVDAKNLATTEFSLIFMVEAKGAGEGSSYMKVHYWVFHNKMTVLPSDQISLSDLVTVSENALVGDRATREFNATLLGANGQPRTGRFGKVEANNGAIVNGQLLRKGQFYEKIVVADTDGTRHEVLTPVLFGQDPNSWRLKVARMNENTSLRVNGQITWGRVFLVDGVMAIMNAKSR